MGPPVMFVSDLYGLCIKNNLVEVLQKLEQDHSLQILIDNFPDANQKQFRANFPTPIKSLQ